MRIKLRDCASPHTCDMQSCSLYGEFSVLVEDKVQICKILSTFGKPTHVQLGAILNLYLQRGLRSVACRTK